MLFNEYILKSFEGERRGLKDLTLEQINFLELASNAFQETPLLKNLTLDGREYSDAEDPIIRILPKNLFAGLNKLENLEIKALWLTVLDENIFQDLVELKVLELIYDIFDTLPEKIFLGITDCKLPPIILLFALSPINNPFFPLDNKD